MKKILNILLYGFIIFSLPGCSSNDKQAKEDIKKEAKVAAEEKNKEEEKKNLVDKAFMEALSTGLEKRWDSTDDSLVIKSDWDKYPTLELEEIEGFENQEFNDPELKSLAVEYINHLREQKNIPRSATEDLANTGLAWNSTGNDRCRLLTQFKEKYGLIVDEKYNNNLNMMAENYHDENYDTTGLVSELHIEEFNDNGGVLHYKLSGVNDTDITFNDLSFQLQVEDREGAIIGQVYSNPIAVLSPGQKFTVDIYGSGAEQFPSIKDVFIYVSYSWN